MKELFNQYIYDPLLNSLIFLAGYMPGQDLGLAIIILTLLIRIVLFPLFYKGAKDQAILQRLAPKIKEIQENHKDDRAKQAQAMLDIYREHKVNPFTQFIIILIQLPVLIALYWVFLGVKELNINHYFLGFIDLSVKNLLLVILAALAQYYQGKLALPKANTKKDLTPMEQMGRQMVVIGPMLTIAFLMFLPSAVALYWLTTSLFSIVQQMWINKQLQVSDEKLIDIDKKLHNIK